MYTHSDPTASRAIGAAEKEWKRMAVLAYRFRTEPGFADRLRDPRQLFTGVFSRLLTDPLDELEATVFRNKGLPRKR